MIAFGTEQLVESPNRLKWTQSSRKLLIYSLARCPLYSLLTMMARAYSINLCIHSVFHTRMKHFVNDYHFVGDLVASKELQVSHVPTNHQLVSLLTKFLSHSHHAFILNKIDVRSPSSILRGPIGTLFIHHKQ